LPCYAADVAHFPAVAAGVATPLRAIFQLAGAKVFALAGRATQLLDWQNHHRFCGRCGTPTAIKADELAMQCPGCGLLAYPRISPAVMVLVRDGDKLCWVAARISNPAYSAPWPALSNLAKHWRNAPPARFVKKWALILPTSAISAASHGLFPIR
jgi:NADH pyrophosphatase NudC (nudix superfamily)